VKVGTPYALGDDVILKRRSKCVGHTNWSSMVRWKKVYCPKTTRKLKSSKMEVLSLKINNRKRENMMMMMRLFLLLLFLTTIGMYTLFFMMP
jgi:hypothetical protein